MGSAVDAPKVDVSLRSTRERWPLTNRTVLVATVALTTLGCGNSGGSASSSGTAGASSRGGQGGTVSQTGGAGITGGAGTTGAGAGGMSGAGGTSTSGAAGATGGSTGMGGMIPIGGSTGVYSCTPGVEQLIITDCGYPSTETPLSSTVFNENEVFRAIRPAGSWPNGVVQMFYNDEHAMTLGVREVVVKDSSGTTTMDYPVTPLATNPSSATDPLIGTSMLVGDQSGLDASLRPMWPSLFITDISVDPASRVGDWQQGGRPLAPNAIFGSWKAAVRTVDKTKTPAVTSITPDADPTKNNWNLSAGSDPVPSGLSNEGYGAEARWNVSLAPGHSYRLQVLVHDGDQNKGGGDSGEACVLFCAGSSCGSEGCNTTGTGGAGGNCGSEGCGTCPAGYPACGPGGIAPSACPSGTVCANGCCLIQIN